VEVEVELEVQAVAQALQADVGGARGRLVAQVVDAATQLEAAREVPPGLLGAGVVGFALLDLERRILVLEAVEDVLQIVLGCGCVRASDERARSQHRSEASPHDSATGPSRAGAR
jgi:hypothetical protein